jgi:lactate permease
MSDALCRRELSPSALNLTGGAPPLFPAQMYIQHYDPLGNPWLSTFVAALPVLVLFLLLVVARAHVPVAAAGGAVAAFVGATLIYHMPAHQAGLAFLSGALFGLMPICWTIIWAMFLYNTTVVMGTFTDIRNSVAGLSADHRIQGVLIAFCFGAFLEGAAGGGTPVAICAAMLVGLGFDPFLAAGLCLIANTSPVAYGGFGTPLLTLGKVTDLPPDVLSKMAGNQLPLLSCVVPLWLVRCMCSWKDTKPVLPAIAVAGGSFALCQFFFAHSSSWQLTDIAGGLLSLVITAVFLNFWKPKDIWRFETHGKDRDVDAPVHVHVEKMKVGPVLKAWMPYILLCALMIYIGVANAAPAKLIDKTWSLGSLRMAYEIPIEGLNGLVQRTPPVVLEGTKPEASVYTFNWLSSPGTSVMITALFVLAILRVNRKQLKEITRITVRQMGIPVPTIICMLGMAYTTRLSGMDATLGLAFAHTGVAYPYFAAMLGWLGVFLTGTDAGSNALFGSLQKITAMQIGLNPVLITVANSTGGVMGKMIDAQSICVATAATEKVGTEADIFKFVIWHSVALASIVGVIVLLQAYVPFFQAMVPILPAGP